MKMKKRKDFEKNLFDLLNPLKDYYSKEGARLDIGHTSAHYEDDSVAMESFARPLWGLAPFWNGGGKSEFFEEIYKKGMAAGTNPQNGDYWHTCRDFDQKFVEMAGLAYAILMAPSKVWEPLAEEEKEKAVEWLWEINRYECVPNNWQFFCVLTNVALKSVGRNYSKKHIEDSLSVIEESYIGKGWYADGVDGQKDYYIAFAIHFYSMIYTMFMEEEDKERCEKFKERAKLFAQDFVCWFAKEGEAIPYGRSMTYRFAQVAFFSICVAAKVEVLPYAVMKGIIERHFEKWLQSPICDGAGILTIGYGYPNLQMSECYNAPGSPYWALKSFAILALPKNDNFWEIKAEPLPKLESIKKLGSEDMVVQRIGRHVAGFPIGQTRAMQLGHFEEKYSKFVYSTKYGFSIARSQKNIEEAAPDSMLAFEVFGHIFVRGLVIEGNVDDTQVVTKWSPLAGIEVTTTIKISKTGHTREHQIKSAYECMAYECGFAVHDTGKNQVLEKENTVAVENETGTCVVTLIKGQGRGQVIKATPNTNLLYSKTLIPCIKYEIHKGDTYLETEISY